MANSLDRYPSINRFTHMTAFNMVDAYFNNGMAKDNPNAPSEVTIKAINENVSFYYVPKDGLVAIYDDTTGDLYLAFELMHKYAMKSEEAKNDGNV